MQLGGMRRHWVSREFKTKFWFQFATEKTHAQCLLHFGECAQQLVPEGVCIIAEWPCTWMLFVCVLTEPRGAESALGREAERTWWIIWWHRCPAGIVAQFHAHTGVWERIFYSIHLDWQQVQKAQDWIKKNIMLSRICSGHNTCGSILELLPLK